MDGNQRDAFTIVVWKSLPLESILRELDIADDEFLAYLVCFVTSTIIVLKVASFANNRIFQ